MMQVQPGTLDTHIPHQLKKYVVNDQKIAAPRALSPFEEIRGAIDGLSIAAERANGLANRLVGLQPAMSSSKIDNATYDGAIPQLHADAEAIRAYVMQINEDLSRIERALP